jgi:hypothetical protein
MIRFLSLEYSVDGPPPSRVDRVLRRHGLVRDGTFYYLEVSSEGEMYDMIDRLHSELAGSGLRYRISAQRPEPEAPGNTSRDEVMRWARAGLVGEEAIGLLDRDEEGFRMEALKGMHWGVDRVLAMRREERMGRSEQALRDASKEQIGILLRMTGERTFQELVEAFDMDEAMMEGVLQEMIDEGLISAAQKGHAVTYRHSGRPLRYAGR